MGELVRRYVGAWVGWWVGAFVFVGRWVSMGV